MSGRFSGAGDDYGGFNPQQVVSADKQLERGFCPEYVVRRLFKPREGVWLASDAKQIEYRIFAHFSNDADILAQYATDPETDYHNIVQALLQKVDPNIGRKHTKIANFCKLFGAGLNKFALQLGTITQAQFEDNNRKYSARDRHKMREEPMLRPARDVYDAYERMFPAADRTLQRAKEIAASRGYVKTFFGRRARFPKKQRLHSALNRVIQGTAADINKVMLVDLYEKRHEFGLTFRLTVHDEFDGDLKDPGMLPKIQRWFNEQRVPLKIPILWDAGVGPTWADAKGKA